MRILFFLLLISSSVFGQSFIERTATVVADSSKFQTTLGVGTRATSSPLTVANFTTSFTAPQTGTLVHLISSGISINPRISFDAYNGTNVNGSIFQGRRAGGSAGSPTAALADYTLAGFAGDGYGVDSFHNISVGA